MPLRLPLTTERLTLRAFVESDVDDVLSYHSQPQVARYLLGGPLDRDGAVAKVERHRAQRGLDTPARAVAVAVEHDGRVIGDIGIWLTDESPSKAEVGWVFCPRHQGQGLATEAVSAFIAAVFASHPLHRLEAQMDARNAASGRLCERLGMTREAHLRQDFWSKGEWTDTIKYGLLAGEPGTRGACAARAARGDRPDD